nr:GNAT family N-acetyltransferase [Leptolyngbya sp. FACHB-541]
MSHTAALGNSDIAAQIRPVSPDDLPGLFQLIQAKAEFDRQLHQFNSDPDALSRHLFGSPRYLEALVVEQAGQLVGFATFSPNYSTFLTQPGIYLEDLFVLPEYRAQGIGKTLLAKLAQIALDRHCGRLEWLVATWNERAIAFYQYMGATILPDWRICRVVGEAIASLAGSGAKS